jgi:hypothetical protein
LKIFSRLNISPRVFFAILFFVSFSGSVVAQPWLEAYEKEAEPTLLKAYGMRDQKKSTELLTAVFKRAWSQLVPIAKAGDPVAQYYLARHYQLYSIIIDLRAYKNEALHWAQQSSDQGYPPAHLLVLEQNQKMSLAMFCSPKDKDENSELCKQKLSYVKRASEGGCLDNVAALILSEGKGNHEEFIARAYIWQRLQADFSPPVDWAGLKAFPAHIQEEMEEMRKESTEKTKAINELAKSKLSQDKIALLDKEYVQKKDAISKTILQWKNRYPALPAGEHGWYAK